jgi:hypothetical protein
MSSNPLVLESYHNNYRVVVLYSDHTMEHHYPPQTFSDMGFLATLLLCHVQADRVVIKFFVKDYDQLIPLTSRHVIFICGVA